LKRKGGCDISVGPWEDEADFLEGRTGKIQAVQGKGTPNYKNVVSYGIKLLGFKTEPKSGQKIGVSRLVSPNTAIHEITNKQIKALITARKGEKASHWTIKHELQTLRGAMRLARDLGYHVNLDINWPTKDLKTKRGRLRFLTKKEELRLLAELDPNRAGRGLPPVEERQPKQLSHIQDNYDFVIALLDTGMRYDEMAKLPWSGAYQYRLYPHLPEQGGFGG
jgi:integrase